MKTEALKGSQTISTSTAKKKDRFVGATDKGL
jgi:hypothetical protein